MGRGVILLRENIAANQPNGRIEGKKTSVKQMKFVVRLAVIKFSILQNAFSEHTKTLGKNIHTQRMHTLDEPKKPQMKVVAVVQQNHNQQHNNKHMHA